MKKAMENAKRVGAGSRQHEVEAHVRFAAQIFRDGLQLPDSYQVKRVYVDRWLDACERALQIWLEENKLNENPKDRLSRIV